MNTKKLDIKILENGALPTEFKIDNFNWQKDYMPEVFGTMGFIPEEGFKVTLTAIEKNPKITCYNIDDDVYKDSCMEAFINFYPQMDRGYINFEMNAAGAMLCGFGKERDGRESVHDMGITLPAPKVTIEENSWTLTLLIPFSFIKDLYGRCDFKEGDVLTGNFFKCGDETEVEHYASWAPIKFDIPNFHLPEFFGELTITK